MSMLPVMKVFDLNMWDFDSLARSKGWKQAVEECDVADALLFIYDMMPAGIRMFGVSSYVNGKATLAR